MAINKRLIKSNDEGGGGAASFNTVTYTGNGGTQAITGVGFQPDLVWTKSRTDSYDHGIQDSVRGVNSLLYPSLTVQEAITSAATQSFDSDGFTYGSNNKGNASAINYVAWCWKAAGYANTFNVLENGSTTSSATAGGAGITAGSITNGWSVSANRDAGFSIVKWTSDNSNTSTVGHGLGVAPNVIISKARNRTDDNWGIYHSSLGLTKSLMFNSNAFIQDSGYWPIVNDTGFCGGVGFQNNQVWNRISYCFAEVAGFSKFGSYTGNGGNQTITTDFEPKFVIIKCSSAGESYRNWFMLYKDGSSMKAVIANGSTAEFNETATTFNSDNFNINCGGCGEYNQSGQTYIYMAFANQF